MFLYYILPLMIPLLIIFSPILFFIFYTVRNIRSLKREIQELKINSGQIKEPVNNLQPENHLESLAVTQEQPPVVNETQQQGSESQIENAPFEQQPDIMSDFFTWFKENWILKTGIFLILLGFGWFVSYAFVQGWIGPFGKILVGFFLGIITILLGNYRMTKSTKQGSALVILAVAILLVTVFSASYVYKMFPPMFSLAVVFIIAAYVNVIALQFNLKSLSLSGLVIATLAPFFANSNESNFVFLFSYLAVVILAHLWIMFYKNWRIIGAASPILLFVYSFIYFGSNSFNSFLGKSSIGSENLIIFLIVSALALILFLSNIFSINKFSSDDKEVSSDGVLAVFNSALIMTWVLVDPFINSLVSPDNTKSLILSLWMIIFALGSYFVFIKTKKLNFFYLYSLTSILYLVVVTALQLEGNSLVFAYIFESAIISLVGYIVTSKLEVGHKLSLLMIGPALMSFQSFYSSAWRYSVFNQDFFILLSMTLVLLGIGYFYLIVKKDEDPTYISGINVKPHTVLIIVGSLFGYGLIWVSFAAMYDYFGVVLALGIYTIIGLWSYFFGKFNDRNIYKRYGTYVLLAVIARLFIIDIWNMAIELKVVTFVVVGLMFVSTAFIGKEEKDKLLSDDVNVK